jgi:hypothetical protein
VRELLLAAGPTGPFQMPGPGSADVRLDLKLFADEVRTILAERGTDAARARLAHLTTPDLWAGTVQDGVARGLMVALEEAASLCSPAIEPTPEEDPEDQRFERRELRRKRDILVASAGARVRFSRKGGILLVDRENGVHAENCVWFEDRRDAGDLDGFVPVDGDRPRLFNPGFLVPTSLQLGAKRDSLVLVGRLGRRPSGFPCRLDIEGRKHEEFVRIRVCVRNEADDHRLRIRFFGIDHRLIRAVRTTAWESVEHRGRRFVAATIVRACGILRVGPEAIRVPAAQCRGDLVHEFLIGGAVPDANADSPMRPGLGSR